MLPRFRRRRDQWLDSDFPALPPAGEGEDAAVADYRVLFDGLAQLLKRCTPPGAERHFPAALMGFRGLKQLCKHGRRPELPAQLLSDLCHEIAQHAEPATLNAAVRCLRRRALECPAPVASPSVATDDSTTFLLEGWEEAGGFDAPRLPGR